MKSFKELMSEAKPGWMLKADPELAKRVKEKTDAAKVRQQSYGDPSKGKSVKEEAELDEAAMTTKSVGNAPLRPLSMDAPKKKYPAIGTVAWEQLPDHTKRMLLKKRGHTDHPLLKTNETASPRGTSTVSVTETNEGFEKLYFSDLSDELVAEEVEELDEVSDKTLKSYMTHGDQQKEYARKEKNRQKGISRAVDRLYPRNEEAELDEVFVYKPIKGDTYKGHVVVGYTVHKDNNTKGANILKHGETGKYFAAGGSSTHPRAATQYHDTPEAAAKAYHKGKLEESNQQGDTMSTMDQYLAAIAGAADFRTSLDEKKLTPAEMKKREEIAQAMERENPDMPMGKKMAIATATAKKVTEETEQIDEGVSATAVKAAIKHVQNRDYESAIEKVKSHPPLHKKLSAHLANADKSWGKMNKSIAKVHAAKTPEAEEKHNADSIHHEREANNHETMAWLLLQKHAKGIREETEQIDEAMISYSDFMDKIAMHRKAGNKVVDHKYTDKKATMTTVDKEGMGRTVTHTPTGSKVENHGKMSGQDDESDETEVKQTEKRGRGRPAGSKSGARH